MVNDRSIADADTQKSDQDVWLSIGEAAEFLGMSRDTLRRWEKVGKIKVYRSPTNRRIYKQSDLEELYQARTKGLAVAAAQPESKPEEVKEEKSIEAKPISEPNTDTTAPASSEIQTPPLSTPQPVSPPPPVEPPISPPIPEPSLTKVEQKTEAQSLQTREEIANTPTVQISAPTQLPTTPIEAQTPQINEEESKKISSSTDESNSTKVLKIVAIILALVLMGVGITIMILVFA